MQRPIRQLSRGASYALAIALAACAGGGSSGGSAAPGSGNAPGTGVPATAGPVPGDMVGGPAAAPIAGPRPEGRALWVTRWHANTEARIRAVVDYAVQHGFNMLLLQVLGDGYALYPSALVPRSSLTSGGFDPLALAVSLARPKGIEVHAWINAVRVYHGGGGAPSSSAHVMRQHPEWSMVKSDGTRSFDRTPTSGAEIYACPAWAGFRDHLVGISRELATRYAIDGVHLDYIRYPSGTSYCYCSEHRRQFQARYGRAPTASDPDWRAFRFGVITDLIRAIHDAVAAARPSAAISATRTGFFSFQDPEAWFRDAELDILFPMIYTSDLARFERETQSLLMMSRGRHVMPGISVTAGRIGEEIDLGRLRGATGYALFASNQLDSSHDSLIAARQPTGTATPSLPWQDGAQDARAPLMDQLQVLPGQTQLTVEWRTDEEAAGRVEVRPDGASWDQAFAFREPGPPTTQHRVTVPGLLSRTRYTLHAVATDAAGNWRSSVDVSATTLVPGPVDVVVDDGEAGYVEQGQWSSGSSSGGNGGDYRYASRSSGAATASVTFRPPLPQEGLYRVSVWYVSGSNRVSDARFTVTHSGGSDAVLVNQRATGRQWVELGTFRFLAGSHGVVELANAAQSSGVVIADAVRFERLGP